MSDMCKTTSTPNKTQQQGNRQSNDDRRMECPERSSFRQSHNRHKSDGTGAMINKVPTSMITKDIPPPRPKSAAGFRKNEEPMEDIWIHRNPNEAAESDFRYNTFPRQRRQSLPRMSTKKPIDEVFDTSSNVSKSVSFANEPFSKDKDEIAQNVTQQVLKSKPPEVVNYSYAPPPRIAAKSAQQHQMPFSYTQPDPRSLQYPPNENFSYHQSFSARQPLIQQVPPNKKLIQHTSSESDVFHSMSKMPPRYAQMHAVVQQNPMDYNAPPPGYETLQFMVPQVQPMNYPIHPQYPTYYPQSHSNAPPQVRYPSKPFRNHPESQPLMEPLHVDVSWQSGSQQQRVQQQPQPTGYAANATPDVLSGHHRFSNNPNHTIHGDNAPRYISILDKDMGGPLVQQVLPNQSNYYHEKPIRNFNITEPPEAPYYRKRLSELNIEAPMMPVANGGIVHRHDPLMKAPSVPNMVNTKENEFQFNEETTTQCSASYEFTNPKLENSVLKHPPQHDEFCVKGKY